MKCRLCSQNEVGQNGYVCQECMTKASYQEKVNITLQDSEKGYDWGLAFVTPGVINLVPEEAELCGYWHRYAEGTYWIGLTMPIQALQDRAFLLTAELAARRQEGLALMGPVKTSKPRTGASKAKPTPIIEAPKTTGAEVVDAMQALRTKLHPKA